MTGQMIQRIVRSKAGHLLIVTAAYYVTGRLGALQAIPPGYATAIWPSGVALAALPIFGHHVWPGIALGSFLNAATAAAPPAAETLLRSRASPPTSLIRFEPTSSVFKPWKRRKACFHESRWCAWLKTLCTRSSRYDRQRARDSARLN